MANTRRTVLAWLFHGSTHACKYGASKFGQLTMLLAVMPTEGGPFFAPLYANTSTAALSPNSRLNVTERRELRKGAQNCTRFGTELVGRRSGAIDPESLKPKGSRPSDVP